MKHIAGILNMADNSTKALGWILHLWHAHQAIGHHHPSTHMQLFVELKLPWFELGEGAIAYICEQNV